MLAARDEAKPTRFLRLEAEQVRLGNRRIYAMHLANALGMRVGDIDQEKLRQHFLEAARRIEGEK